MVSLLFIFKLLLEDVGEAEQAPVPLVDLHAAVTLRVLAKHVPVRLRVTKNTIVTNPHSATHCLCH